MVSKKKSARKSNPSSKLSTLASSSTALTASAFSPPSLRLSLFASVVLGLDAYRLRIHDINTSRLRCEHVFEKGVSANYLAWGSMPSKDKKSAKKKRKRMTSGESAADEVSKNTVVAAATNRGTVVLFSPIENGVVGLLEGEHVGPVKCFVFSEEEQGRGWSCDTNGKFVYWDIERKASLRYVKKSIYVFPSLHQHLGMPCSAV
jgi:U3 small nucleolar RNA-associated protein 5